MSRKLQALLQVEVTVPSYFVCPISLELMRDPVTLSSGQTFDRSSIQTWLDEGHQTCPVTRSPLDPLEDPIPNHALRRLIQSWCLQHASLGIDRVVTPRQPPSLSDIPLLLDSLSSCSSPSDSFQSLDALQRLSRLALDRPLSRRTILLSGALPLLSKLLSRSFISGLAPPATPSAPATPGTSLISSTADEALKLLDLLIDDCHDPSISDHHKQLCMEELIVSLAHSLLRGSKADSRQKAASILLRLQASDSLKRKMGEMQGFMGSLVAMMREGALSSKAALGLLVEVCSTSNRNRVLATEAGAMRTLVELLVGSDRATMETTLKGLELLCQCAEGRAQAANDPSILAAVVKQMSAVSERAAHYAIHIVLRVTKWAPEASKVKSLVVKEGALLKAIAVAQSAAASDTRLAARKLAASLSDALPPSHLSHTIRLM